MKAILFLPRPLAFRQSHGHGATCFSRRPFNFGDVGFGGPWVSAVSALVYLENGVLLVVSVSVAFWLAGYLASIKVGLASLFLP